MAKNLSDAFIDELQSIKESPGSSKEQVAAASCGLEWISTSRDSLSRALSYFRLDGRLHGGAPFPASAYNDLYKFTMCPVIRAVEASRGHRVCVTFAVNIRDKGYRQSLHASATGSGDPHLFEEVKHNLQSLQERKFDRKVFEQIHADMGIPGWNEVTLDYVCGPPKAGRALIERFEVTEDLQPPSLDPPPEDAVVVRVFVAQDARLGEERVHIEACGPWSRSTWLETTMMQAVYDALLRHKSRIDYKVERAADGTWDDSGWYPRWLAEAFVRCVRSVEAANASGLRGALFTGRRTGGLALMMIQALYFQDALRDKNGASMSLGTSSVTSHYWLKDAGVDKDKIARPAGTHAHELQMVLGALIGELDNVAGVPLSQAISHMLYFYLSCPKGDVREGMRKALMPILPDTLTTPAFMKVASKLTIPRGPHQGDPILSVVGAARQDSGSIAAFADLMRESGFQGKLFASEIESNNDFTAASASGFSLFGAGGFFGDSEKAWDATRNNISMAVKPVRVHANCKRTTCDPIKLGDSGNSGKLECDGMMTAERHHEVVARAKQLAEANFQVSDEEVQAMFNASIHEFLGNEYLGPTDL